ncbi:MAG: hypothetical protein NTV70_08910 [Acidobacteria bacterium]|nr:hypothetical protein [Acidobacteriota bacterium]
MSKLSSFFEGSGTNLGVFYPNHYLLATFPNLADAQNAQHFLQMSGYEEDRMISASGRDVISFSEGRAADNGLVGLLMTGLSRLIGTEAVYADQDLAEARKGSAFIAVHCPDEKSKVHIWNLLAPRNPLVARYYTLAGIEHLAGDQEN